MSLLSLFNNTLEEEWPLVSKPYTQLCRQLTNMENSWTSTQFRSDLVEYADRYELWCDLPGVSKENIRLEFQNNRLGVHGERWTTKENNYRHRERAYGSFSRVFPLPHDVDTTNLLARYVNGILIVTLSRTKSQESETQTIQVQ